MFIILFSVVVKLLCEQMATNYTKIIPVDKSVNDYNSLNDYPIVSNHNSLNDYTTLDLLLQYEQLLAEYRTMRFKLPQYNTQWQQVLQTRTAKQLKQSDNHNDFDFNILPHNHPHSLPHNQPSQTPEARARLIHWTNVLQVKETAAQQETHSQKQETKVQQKPHNIVNEPETKNNIPLDELVFNLIHRYWYDLFPQVQYDSSVMDTVVQVLKHRVENVRRLTMWQYGHGNDIEKQYLLQQLFEPTPDECLQQQIHDLGIQITAVEQIKQERENDLREMTQRFANLQRKTIKTRKETETNTENETSEDVVEDVVDLIQNDMHTMQLKQLQQRVQHYSQSLEKLKCDMEQLQQLQLQTSLLPPNSK